MKDPRLGASGIGDLRQALTRFNDTATRLEGAYRDLEHEKRRIDFELEAKNRELTDTVARLDALLGSLPSGVVATDAAGAIRTVNRAAETILGIRAENWIGRPVEELVDGDGERLILEPTCAASDSERPNTEGPNTERPSTERPSTERWVHCLDGGRRILRRATTAVFDAEGEGLGTLATFTDVTAVRALEESLAQRNRLAEMGEMAQTLAHQIRNPLNGIAGFGNLILERLADDRSDGIDRFANSIVGASRKLEGLVAELLRFAREEAGEADRIELGRVVDDAVEEMTASAGEKRTARIVVTRGRTESEGAFDVLGNASLLRQALRNLIANACDAAGPDGRVRVGLARRGDRVVLRVHDDGPGMDEDVRARVFLPFFTTKESGFGLGLPIARKLVERDGGRLELRTRPSGGCRVRVEFPAVTEEVADATR